MASTAATATEDVRSMRPRNLVGPRVRGARRWAILPRMKPVGRLVLAAVAAPLLPFPGPHVDSWVPVAAVVAYVSAHAPTLALPSPWPSALMPVFAMISTPNLPHASQLAVVASTARKLASARIESTRAASTPARGTAPARPESVRPFRT